MRMLYIVKKEKKKPYAQKIAKRSKNQLSIKFFRKTHAFVIIPFPKIKNPHVGVDN